MPWVKSRKDDEGFALIELLVAMIIILGVLVSIALLTTQALSMQQDGEARDKGVQVARDFMERAKQSSFGNLGFRMSDPGFVSKGTTNTEDTVVIPEDKTTAGLIPLDTSRVVGGVQYTVRTDITWTQTTHATSPKRVRVEVSWKKEGGKTDKTVISYVRSATASEQIPVDLDLTVIPGVNGVPAAPSYYDVVNSTGGYKSIYGTGFMIKVLNQGDYPVTDVEFEITCPSKAPVKIYWASLPAGLTRTQTGTTYQVSYYGVPPASIPCDITTATTVVRAINAKGSSAPLTIAPTNFLVY